MWMRSRGRDRRGKGKTYLYGENFDAILSISASDMYFHLLLLPFALSFEVSRPM